MFITQTSASGSTTSAHLDALRKFKKVKAKVSSVEKVHQYCIQNIVFTVQYTHAFMFVCFNIYTYDHTPCYIFVYIM